jgi:hypothetical protein
LVVEIKNIKGKAISSDFDLLILDMYKYGNFANENQTNPNTII